jgi:hypothetical protein
VFRRPDGRTFRRDPIDVDDAVDVYVYASIDGDLEPLLGARVVGQSVELVRRIR